VTREFARTAWYAGNTIRAVFAGGARFALFIVARLLARAAKFALAAITCTETPTRTFRTILEDHVVTRPLGII
jgi:hypothetical protein